MTGLDGFVAGTLGLLLVGPLDLGRVAAFRLVFAAGLVLVTGLERAFRDADLARLTVAALDLVFALVLVFAAVLAFADFVFFLAAMCAPCSERQPAMTPDDQTKAQVDGARGYWRSKHARQNCIIPRNSSKRRCAPTLR